MDLIFVVEKVRLLQTYGVVEKNPRVVYPDELLSPLFYSKNYIPGTGFSKWQSDVGFHRIQSRNLRLNWAQNKVRLLQRWYDSFGFHDVPSDTSIQFARFPQKEFIAADISYSGKVFSVSLSYSHDLKIRLYLNGKLVATQLCIFWCDSSPITLHRKQMRVMAGTILKPQDVKDVIKVDQAKEYQDILGFGGIASVVAYNELSEQGKKDWWDFLRDYNLLIQREYPNGTQLKEDCSNFW